MLSAGELSRLSHRNEAGSKLIRERRADHIAARFDRNDRMDLLVFKTIVEKIDSRLVTGWIFQKRRNVPE